MYTLTLYRHLSVVKEVTNSLPNKAVCYYQTVQVQEASVCVVQKYIDILDHRGNLTLQYDL